jgi:hypothetical protein
MYNCTYDGLIKSPRVAPSPGRHGRRKSCSSHHHLPSPPPPLPSPVDSAGQSPRGAGGGRTCFFSALRRHARRMGKPRRREASALWLGVVGASAWGWSVDEGGCGRVRDGLGRCGRRVRAGQIWARLGLSGPPSLLALAGCLAAWRRILAPDLGQ